MGDRAADPVSVKTWPPEHLRLRVNCAGLAGKAAPRVPPSIGADGGYYVAGPDGSLRKLYRTPSDLLPGFGEQQKPN